MSKPPRANRESDRHILCVWLPNWPIQRLVAADNALRRTQIVLYRNQPGRGQIVTAVSPAAELSGARPGMPLSEAKSLVGRSRQFHDYHVFEHNPSADLRTLQQLAMECQTFSPIVGLEENEQPVEKEQPGSLLLDISGLTHLFGGEDGLRSQIHEHFQTLGYLVATAIAPTIGQALGLARFGAPDASTCETVEACETGRTETEERNPVFEPLPVQALRLQENTVDTLQQLGVTTIAQIRDLPRAGLRSRFGDEITRRLDQADGVIEEVIEAIYPPPDYEVEEFLEYPLTDRETIQVIMSRLAGKLCRQMKAAGRGGLVWQFQLYGPLERKWVATAGCDLSGREEKAAEVNVKVKAEPERKAGGRACYPLTIKLFQPTARLDQLMPLVEMQMEDLFRGQQRKHRKSKKREQLDFQIQEICVSVRNCVLLAERQRKLFDENPRLDKQTLAHLINRLSSRLGAEHVLRPVLQSGTQPEDTCRFEPLVGQIENKKPKRRPPRYRNAISPMQRPLVLHPQPVEITAVALDGSRHYASSIPAMFVCDNQRLQVTRRWGPERIETAWWRGPTIRRDYWRVETGGHRWLWVYRNLQNRRWFLHGEF